MTDIFHVSDQCRDTFLEKASLHNALWKGLVVNLLTCLTPYRVRAMFLFQHRYLFDLKLLYTAGIQDPDVALSGHHSQDKMSRHDYGTYRFGRLCIRGVCVWDVQVGHLSYGCLLFHLSWAFWV